MSLTKPMNFKFSKDLLDKIEAERLTRKLKALQEELDSFIKK